MEMAYDEVIYVDIESVGSCKGHSCHLEVSTITLKKRELSMIYSKTCELNNNKENVMHYVYRNITELNKFEPSLAKYQQSCKNPNSIIKYRKCFENRNCIPKRIENILIGKNNKNIKIVFKGGNLEKYIISNVLKDLDVHFTFLDIETLRKR